MQLNDVESSDVDNPADLTRALSREDTDAAYRWWNVLQYRRRVISGDQAGTACEDHADVGGAERDRMAGVLGSGQAAKLDLNRHESPAKRR